MGKAPARAESNNVLGHTHETKCVEPCSSFSRRLNDRHEICETALYSLKELEQNFIATETIKEKI